MVRVRFTHHLQRFFPDLNELQVEADTVSEVVTQINEAHPGLADYVVDERGALRKHVNIFVNSEMITDRVSLSDKLSGDEEVFVMQALSGG